MPLVHEAAADGAGARVQILVAAPHGEVGIPIVQLQRHIADGVREVEADARAGAARRGDQRRELEACPVRYCTPGSSTSARPAPSRSMRPSEILGAKVRLAGARRDLDQVFRAHSGRETRAARRSRSDRRGRPDFSIEHAIALAPRPKETHHHQVQIHGERIHGDDFALIGAGQRGEPGRSAARGNWIHGRFAAWCPSTARRRQSLKFLLDVVCWWISCCRPSEWPHKYTSLRPSASCG